jgi:serine/threonine protein kinase
MKIVAKSQLTEPDVLGRIIDEKDALIRIRHPFLVGATFAFQDACQLYIIMEYVQGGELYQRLDEEGKFDVHRSRLYAAELALGIGHLHSLGLIHRDLKPENILFDTGGHIKIADFRLVKPNMVNGATTTTFCGTPDYISPEMIAADPYDKATDWWSYGCLIYEMVVGRSPFYAEDQMVVYRSILDDPVPLYPPLDTDKDLADFLLSLLDKNQKNRLGSGPRDVEDVKAHRFFKDVDWDQIIKREIEMPWKPFVTSEVDTRQFAEVFTSKDPKMTLEDNTNIGSDIQQELTGFSMIAGLSPE